MSSNGPPWSVSSQHRNLDAYVDLFKHWDSSYWKALNVFLVIQSILGATASQIPELPSRLKVGAGAIVVGVGLVTAISWIFLMNRKHVYIDGVESLLYEEIPELDERKKFLTEYTWKLGEGKEPTYLTRVPSSPIAQTVLPTIFAVAWLAVGWIALAMVL